MTALTLEQIKDFLRYDGAADDAALTIMLKGGQNWIERHTNRLMAQREVAQSLPAFAPYHDLRWQPFVADSLSIAYLDSSFAEQTFTDFAVFRFGDGARVVPKSAWPQGATGIRLTYTAGYATVDEIPEVMLHALALYVAASDEERAEIAAGGRTALTFLLEDLHAPVIA